MKTSRQETALVTGASRGIGRGIALRLARDGVVVIVHYNQNRRAANATVRAIEKKGGKAFPIQADLSSLEGVSDLFRGVDECLKDSLGTRKFDILVNNAGISRGGDIEETTEAEFDELIAVNVKAPFFIIQQALPRLRNGGRIINISSGTARIAMPEEVAYAMTKRALDSLTLALAKQLAPRKITVNTVAPGIIDTDFQADWFEDPRAREFAASVAALGRIGRPEDIADVVAFLVSSEARWITGAFIDATGGSLL
ncbi:MAG: SDR family oxidoreductase [Armatimonadetes bacterium]|nr:SDR family oxidoreductase [Armatimonadota bacterium]NIO75584.1 SDR family oxidoreductase [Armatimonadota bacterium]NIO98198.1 SDR family oxidoreductase [Armatimonadota bacterium]